MVSTASEFTMKDQSSKPYAWMIESIELGDIESFGVEKWVREYVKTNINATNNTRASDKTVYRTWRGGWEFDQIVTYIKNAISNS